MIRHHRIDRVVFEEAGNTGVMFAFGPGIVEPVPTDLEFTPALDGGTGHLRERHAIGPTPPGVY